MAANAVAFTVVREYCGHGIGRKMHEEPQIAHYGTQGKGTKLQKGMTFTIEPMINQGSRQIAHLADDWTVVTKTESYPHSGSIRFL